LLFADRVGMPVLLALLLLKPIATILCMRSGVPGGLFTPSLTFGALLGAALGHAWTALWPGVLPGLFALLGAGAVLPATTQGPISAVVLMMELTGRDRSFILPLILIAALSALIARSVEHRSIYDARRPDSVKRKNARSGIGRDRCSTTGIPWEESAKLSCFTATNGVLQNQPRKRCSVFAFLSISI
jgi:H+/Cl- antiporter ClcA